MLRSGFLILAAVLPLAALGLFAWYVATGREMPFLEDASGYVLRVALPPATDGATLPQVAGDADLPLVVIDPGHGGHDPGASSLGLQEKTLVLGLARALRDELLAGGGVRVALTRDEDRYLLHEERFEIARRLGADLFLSIHADSAGEESEVAGASIYTLSADASSEAAARFAARENRADSINGQSISGQSDAVSDILVDLSQDRTQAQSREFARLIEREGSGTLRFHPQAQRSAALKVLRAPDVPSVLYESGFITNAEDARRLASAEGRQGFARAMAQAIRIFLVRQDESLLAPES